MNQINLTDINKDVFKKYLASLNSNTECEIRLGHFVYTDQKSNFAANVEIDFFYRLKHILDSNNDIKKTFLNTKELSFDNINDKKGKIRETTNLTTGNIEYMLKNTYKKHNIFDYDCRISLSSEKQLAKEHIHGINFNTPSFIRYKERYSYEFNCGSLDLTIVKQGKDETNVLSNQYEIEFEISKPNYDEILQILTFIIQTRQNNNFIITTKEKRDIITQYKNLVMPYKKGHPFFIGAQPETLQKDQLSLLFKELYSVTDKADGERFFMFIDNKSKIWFIDNNISNILKTNLISTDYINCILDGELIKKETDNTIKTTFYAFDILFNNNKDLRGNNDFLLKQRLELTHTIIDNINKHNNSSVFDIVIKKFIYRNVFIGSEIIMKDIHNKPYTNDGLIFTPMNEPYPTTKKWPKLLKWKPAELNTIDFYSVKNTENEWELFVQDTSTNTNTTNNKHTTHTTILFDVNLLCNTPKTKNITFKTTFDEHTLDPTTNQAYQTNTVIEFKWDTTLQKFIPLRTRWDKTTNPNKHGNHVTVACNIWNNINNPITPQQLFQMTNSTTQHVDNTEPFFFEKMTKLLSHVKQYLIKKYTSHNELHLPILELNTFNQIKLENTFTFCNSIKKSNKQFKNVKLDLYDTSSATIIKNTTQQRAENIFCLKFNTFLKSQNTLDNFINIINSNIKNNGKLILLFIDTNLSQHTSLIKNNEIMYSINNFSTTQNYGNYVKLFINGTSNENEPIEYIIDYNFLLQYMKTKNFICIESESLGNYKNNFENLLEHEQHISNIYRFCIFEKININTLTISNTYSTITNTNTITDTNTITNTSTITDTNTSTITDTNTITNTNTITDTTKTDIDTNTNTNTDTINLTFHKIYTLFDIFDAINCTQFTIFKYKYDNFEIKSLEDCNIINTLTPFIAYSNNSNSNNLSSEHKYIYFINYTEQTEHSDTESESQPINNFFIVLQQHSLYTNSTNIQLISNKLTSLTLPAPTCNQNTQLEIENSIRLKLHNNNTVVQLKEYLKILGCKINGNKQDLLNRLQEKLSM